VHAGANIVLDLHAAAFGGFQVGKSRGLANRWPLIRFMKDQILPRFRKPMSHPLAHPAVQREPVEANRSTLARERNLAPADAVIEAVPAHAEVPCG
jgi:hypothetical protein